MHVAARPSSAPKLSYELGVPGHDIVDLDKSLVQVASYGLARTQRANERMQFAMLTK